MERVNVPVVLEFGDTVIDANASIPAERMRPADLLPILLRVTDAVVAVAQNVAAREGKQISCKAGCGACCRQLVPVSEAEARYVAELVADMPADQREAVQRRFADAIESLGEDVVSKLRRTDELKSVEVRRAAGEEYFRRGVACPFLVEEKCSIHPHRPAVCREYMVASPAENCSRPGPETLDIVHPPVRPSAILRCFGDGIGNESTRWVPLVLALEWAEQHTGEPQHTYDAPQMFRNFVAQMGRTRD